MRSLEGDEEEAPVDNIAMGNEGETSINWATTFTDGDGNVFDVLGGIVKITLPEYDGSDTDDDDKYVTISCVLVLHSMTGGTVFV